MKRKSMFFYIFIPHALALLLTLVAAGGWALRGAREEHYEQTRDNLRRAALMLADAINQLPDPNDAAAVDALCKRKGTVGGYRFTVVSNSGRVIGDSDEKPHVMDDHYLRPEIRQLHDEPLDAVGWSARRSGTVRLKMMYVAVVWRHADERLGFIRAARPMGDVDLALIRQRTRVLYAGLWMGVIVVIGSAVIAGWLSEPLVRMRDEVKAYIFTERGGGRLTTLTSARVREIHSLAEAMNEMARNLDERMKIILRQRDEQNALFSCMTEAVIAVDIEGKILSMNPAARKIFGAPTGNLEGRAIQEVVRNTDIQRIWRKVMDGAAIVKEEFTIPDGKRCLQANGAAMTDGKGQRIGCVLVMTDITRLRQLEIMRRDFVANVSHELKTPITSISGFAETLVDDVGKPEDRKRFLQIIHRQARRLAAILEDLLTLSRLEHDTETHEIPLSATRLMPLLENAARSWRDAAAEKGMTVDVTGDGEATAVINAPLLEQALLNLVGNAVKYGLENTRVILSVGMRDAQIILRVADEGPGIARHHLSRLFERFYRVDKGRSREIGGTGLGLAIVKRIAVAHGGRVAVDSAPGKGSVFSIVLPAPRHLKPL